MDGSEILTATIYQGAKLSDLPFDRTALLLTFAKLSIASGINIMTSLFRPSGLSWPLTTIVAVKGELDPSLVKTATDD